MARFDVRRLDNSAYLALELQADLLDGFNTRVVAPLIPKEDIGGHISRLNPVFTIGGGTYVMLTQHLAAVPTTELGDVVCNLGKHRDDITAATDFLFQGF
ncbi:CcdB family protein [Roseibium sediminicola]|uniref:Toxin CcdB n=1 Tax=Roseibium sediminicola TaxID=2933272 RepID=A0ABT0GXH1_9HYPH|nr:CcdB family protein [Roseibium sp. CAU 1639]MCK7614133.1 CcdB family protein [Roseibium sp. CAU 1639]